MTEPCWRSSSLFYLTDADAAKVVRAKFPIFLVSLSRGSWSHPGSPAPCVKLKTMRSRPSPMNASQPTSRAEHSGAQRTRSARSEIMGCALGKRHFRSWRTSIELAALYHYSVDGRRAFRGRRFRCIAEFECLLGKRDLHRRGHHGLGGARRCLRWQTERSRASRIRFAFWACLAGIWLGDATYRRLSVYGPPQLLVYWGLLRLQPSIQPLASGGVPFIAYAQISHSLEVILLGLVGAALGRLLAVKDDRPYP